nr:MAG TPA: hypothetical protein [Caudoviricetes sp.]
MVIPPGQKNEKILADGKPGSRQDKTTKIEFRMRGSHLHPKYTVQMFEMRW